MSSSAEEFGTTDKYQTPNTPSPIWIFYFLQSMGQQAAQLFLPLVLISATHGFCRSSHSLLKLLPRSGGFWLHPVDDALESVDDDSDFGSRKYWEKFYAESSGGNGGDSFSWYSGWEDLRPFIQELIPDPNTSLLIPGVGNDPLLRDMYDDGYHTMVAFDYAASGVACARKLMGNDAPTDILVADARDLSSTFADDSFQAIVEKGTLDAIYLSGGKDKQLAQHNLNMAVREFSRIMQPGGMLVSLSAACTDGVKRSFTEVLATGGWDEIRNGDFYVTENGYTSNNIDGTLLVWKKKT